MERKATGREASRFQRHSHHNPSSPCRTRKPFPHPRGFYTTVVSLYCRLVIRRGSLRERRLRFFHPCSTTRRTRRVDDGSALWRL